MANKKEEKIEVKEKVIKLEEGQNIIMKPEKKRSTAYSFGKVFGERLRSDKLFLLSFLITLIFVGYLMYSKLKDSQSIYPGFMNSLMKSDEQEKDNTTSNVNVVEELNIADYVGVYSREVTLNEKIKLSNTCTLENYKVVYQIKKDKTINKFLFNDCLGVIKMWSDSLDYIINGGTKYIGTSNIHFLFSGTSMKEVDGETYKIDEDISSLKEKKSISDLTIDFYNNSVVFMTKTNLVLMRGNTVLFNLNRDYPNNGGDIERYVYKISDKDYRFIVFSNGEKLNCYKDSTEEVLLYRIYSITYDEESINFGTPKELVSRNKKDSCDYVEQDLKTLKGE